MPMLRDRPADADPDEPTPDDADVVAWGDDAAPRRRRTFRLLDRIRADARTTPLTVAALGLAAVFGSLASDWATMILHRVGTPTSEFQPNQFTAAASDVGIGPGYLVGVLAIVALTGVATFGTPPVRHNARIAGMATAAGLLVLLVAATVSLDATGERMFQFDPQVEVDVRYGLGLTLAYAATAALGLALYLANRPQATRSPAPDDRDPEQPTEPGERRQPRRGWTEPDEPVRDITVLPAPPFTGPDWRQQYPP
ncbi:MAG TPA: hypothetical protein VHN18_18165 [Micromonosporaceae bacterium]|nr:hypothetical protein [Micromonosporaceae bacterium]